MAGSEAVFQQWVTANTAEYFKSQSTSGLCFQLPPSIKSSSYGEKSNIQSLTFWAFWNRIDTNELSKQLPGKNASFSIFCITIFERCLDWNPESCRNKQLCYQLMAAHLIRRFFTNDFYFYFLWVHLSLAFYYVFPFSTYIFSPVNRSCECDLLLPFVSHFWGHAIRGNHTACNCTLPRKLSYKVQYLPLPL